MLSVQFNDVFVNSLCDNVKVGALDRWYSAVGMVCRGMLDGSSRATKTC